MRRATKRTVTAVLLAGLTLAAVPAWGGAEISPTGYKLLKGTQDSDDPVAELANDDNDYLVLYRDEPNSDHLTSYQATFTDIPALTGSTRVRIILAAKGTPTCSVKLWHWRKERFVTLGSPIAVDGPEIDSNLEVADPASRFVRGGKARARVSCTDDTLYAVGTELLHFLP